MRISVCLALSLLIALGAIAYAWGPASAGLGQIRLKADATGDSFVPSTEGEIGGTGQPKGKIACMNNRLDLPGLPLPVR